MPGGVDTQPLIVSTFVVRRAGVSMPFPLPPVRSKRGQIDHIATGSRCFTAILTGNSINKVVEWY